MTGSWTNREQQPISSAFMGENDARHDNQDNYSRPFNNLLRHDRCDLYLDYHRDRYHYRETVRVQDRVDKQTTPPTRELHPEDIKGKGLKNRFKHNRNGPEGPLVSRIS